MFEIETNRAQRIITVRMIGGFTLDGARDCAAAKEAAVHALGPPYERHSSIVDVRELRIQTRDVFAIFTNFVALTRHKSRRIAIVGGEGTARMQFRRVAERDPLRDNMRFFTDEDDARDWLVEAAAAARGGAAEGPVSHP
jgi:hypothetical protein